MPSIYELTKNQRELMNLIDRGEIESSDAQDTFDGMEHELNDKINDYSAVLRSMNLHLENIDSEISRLSKLKSEKLNQISSVKQRLMDGLTNINRTSFDTGLYKGHIRKGSKSVNVINPEKVPSEYIDTKIVESVNKTEVKKAIESGVSVDGCEIVIGKSSLIIK